MKRGTPNHRKMHRLARCLRVSLAEAVGTMELLWHWVAEYLPRGDVGKSENWEIAAAVHWKGDPDELIAALVAEHWLDESPTCRLMVHDWSEHCEESVHTRLARSREYFADGSRPRLGKLGGAERESAENFYSRGKKKSPAMSQQTLAFSDPTQHDSDSTKDEPFTQGHEEGSTGPQKALAKPSQAKPSHAYIASERKASENGSLAARISPESISNRLHRFMGGPRKPDAAIVQTIAGLLEGYTIETLDAFLQSLNGRKIKSYAFFPTVLRKEIANLTAPIGPPPEPAAEPPIEQKPDEITDYYRWRLEWIKAEYVRKYGADMFAKHLKTNEKALMKEYPSVAVMPRPERALLAERRFLNELSTLPEMQVPKFSDYSLMVASGEISAGTPLENSGESKETAKLVTAGGL